MDLTDPANIFPEKFPPLTLDDLEHFRLMLINFIRRRLNTREVPSDLLESVDSTEQAWRNFARANEQGKSEQAVAPLSEKAHEESKRLLNSVEMEYQRRLTTGEMLPKSRRLSRSELKDGRTVVIQRVGGTNWPKEVYAIVEEDGVFRFVNPSNQSQQTIEAATWEGDTLVHSNGNKFAFYERLPTEQER